MRVVIAGTREGCSYAHLYRAVRNSGFQITHVICGGCRGVDALAVDFATNHRLTIDVRFADWNGIDAMGKKKGRKAGPQRNLQMLAMADALIALPGGGPGTKNIIALAKIAKLYVHEEPVPKEGQWVDDGESYIDPITYSKLWRYEI